jgi:general stress protein YciG
MGIENRGFASLDSSKRREVSSKGGRAAHAKGTAHMWNREEASAAGRKGGMASAQRRKDRLTVEAIGAASPA